MGIAIAIGFVFLIFFIGGGMPPMKKMRKTKLVAIAKPMPIWIGTFFVFFSKKFGPI